MVKHVILWTLKNEYSKEEKEAIKAEIKAGLEGLAGQIPGLLEIHVNINGLESSNADLMLDSTFTDEAALKGYSCLLYTSPSPRDVEESRMPSSA